MDLCQMTALQAAEEIREGRITSKELVRACLDRVDEVDDQIGAWAYLDPGQALAQAEKRDLARQAGEALGPLHGIPVGIKDIFDTVDMPTEFGTPLYAGRRPNRDATTVALLRQAGAVIMGKTVTTELAVYFPGKTRNPHNPEHTPGGSSSGSAAAVAAAMVPLAVGSQTNGSAIRPASYCGVWGYKPTFGLISRRGALVQSRLLDHVGVFARAPEDLASIAETLMVYDDGDPDMQPRWRPDLSAMVAKDPPIEPRFGLVRSPVWDQAEPETQEAFAELTGVLGDKVKEVEIPPAFNDVIGWHRIIMEADIAVSFAREYEKGAKMLSPPLREMIERGQAHLAQDYNRAVERIGQLNDWFRAVFDWHTAVITPATAGPAPRGLESTGSPAFCTLWTYLGMPAVSAPIFRASNGLPFGIQVVGPRGDDARILQAARWLAEFVRDEADGG